MSAQKTIQVGTSAGKPLKLDIDRLIVSRLLVTASSGGGKSWLLRKILEEVSGSVQTIVVDTEGEFATLRELRDMVLAGPQGEVPAEPRSAPLLCRRLMESNLSAVIDVSELKRHDKHAFVASFCNTLVDLPRSLWRPCVVAVDETHEYAAEKEQSESAGALALLASKGRKRGFALLGATQRLSKLDKDVAAEMKNVFIGQLVLDTDLKRAADMLGFGKDRWPEIRDLRPGEFFAFGPAFKSRGVVKIKSGEVRTTHPKAGHGRLSAPPAPSAKIKAALAAELKDIPQQAESEIRTLNEAKKKITELERQVRTAAKQHPAPAPVTKEIRSKQDQQTIGRLRRGLEEAMKAMESMKQIKNEAPQIDREQVTKIIDGAANQIVRLIEQAGAKDRQQVDRIKREVGAVTDRLRKLIDSEGTNGTNAIVAPPTIAHPIARATEKKTSEPVIVGDLTITSAMQKILDALAWWEAVGVTIVDKGALAPIAGYTVNGHFNNLVGNLRTGGLIDYPGGGQIALTDAGRAAAAPPELSPSLDALHQAWKSKLSGNQWKLLEQVIHAHPAALTKDDLAQRAGYTVNGHFNNLLGNLRTYGLITKKGEIAATDLLFPNSLV